MKMIVKVQLAIAGMPQILIYNQDRSFVQQWPAEKLQTLVRKLGPKRKGYFNAEVIHDELIISEQVPSQPW